MIEVDKAIELIDIHIKPSKTVETIPLAISLGHTLAESVKSDIYMPPFNQSAMDGYAVKYHNHNPNETTFTLIGESKAGSKNNNTLDHGQACRVFTGAPVPKNTDAVIMQEKVLNNSNNTITYIEKNLPQKGNNIRTKGSNTKKNESLLHKNHILDAPAIGYLASAGVSNVEVYKKPKIALITTGNELTQLGQTLEYGQIFESNSITISTALKSNGFSSEIYKIKDNYNETKILLNALIDKFDFIITTGGISVGDYDFIRQTLEIEKIKKIFYKINQKPGKPFCFATHKNSYIFALPGNPTSALTCYYLYVTLALKKYMNQIQNFEWKTGTLLNNITPKNKRTLLLKANVDDKANVFIIENQKSDCLKGFTSTNAIAVCQNNNKEYTAGDTIKYINYYYNFTHKK